MKTNLLMDFTVDTENNTVHVIREFNAPISTVWSAWTKPEILDKWWAPKPWVAKTKSMEFKVGGRRLYSMCGPEGEEHWSLSDYTSITPKTNFKHHDVFCDSEGAINEDFQRCYWSVDFSPQNGNTIVNVSIKFDTLADLQKTMEMGFKEGFTIALEGLDDILSPKAL